MKQKPRSGFKRKAKSYPLNQCALYNTSSRSKLAKVLLKPFSDIESCIDQYSRFQVQPKIDPFSAKAPRKKRNVQKPKAGLLAIHDRILKLLKFVSVPEYMQAALSGTSYKRNAAAHAGGEFLATLDLRSFFEATNRSKVFNFFQQELKCPGDIADIYSRLITCGDSLPTGSSLSPLMSFYANKNLFDELNELALRHGLIFTCYIDDLTFSGAQVDGAFIWDVEKIVRKYGHAIVSRKTKLFKAGSPKHVTGVVIFDNEVRVPGSRFRKLRMIDAALDGTGPCYGFSEGELLNIKAGVLSEISYIEPSKKFLARRAIEVLNRRKLVMFGDGKLAVSNSTPATLGPDEVPPWDLEKKTQ